MLETLKSHCPYCGEPIELVVDPSLDHQNYIEDCFVCCRPIQVQVHFDGDGPSVELRSEDEA